MSKCLAPPTSINLPNVNTETKPVLSGRGQSLSISSFLAYFNSLFCFLGTLLCSPFSAQKWSQLFEVLLPPSDQKTKQ